MPITKNILKGNIRVYLSDYTEIAQIAMNKHNTKPLASLVLSTAIAVFGPLGLMKKNGKVTSDFKVEGPIEQIIVDSSVDGKIRAFVKNPSIITDFDNKDVNSIPIKVGMGEKGKLQITNAYQDQTFGGVVDMFKGDITSDLAYYFDQSEQVSSAVVSDVKMKDAKTVQRAYSCIFQLLPGCTEEEIQQLEAFLHRNKMSAFTFEQYEALINGELQAEYKVMWKCNCSKQRMKNILSMLSETERKAILKEHGAMEIKCNFCNQSYRFNDV